MFINTYIKDDLQKSFLHFISERLFFLNVTSVLVELSVFSHLLYQAAAKADRLHLLPVCHAHI